MRRIKGSSSGRRKTTTDGNLDLHRNKTGYPE
jgi:hypothetical protein